MPARHACLTAFPIALAALTGLGCGGAGARPRSAAVLFESRASQTRVEQALESQGVSVAPVPDAPPPADDRIAEARAQLAHAVEAQQSFHEGAALEALVRAEQLATEAGVGPEARRLLAEAGLLRAWLHLSAGRTADAEREVARALAFADPGTPDPAAYPPELVALVERVARRPMRTGTLRIAVRGSDRAQVWIDGRGLGLAPVDAGGIATGQHFVRIEAPGFEVISDRVEVAAGDEAARTYTLALASPGAIAVEASASTGAARLEATRRLAGALEVDGVLVGRDHAGAFTAEWVPREGPVQPIEGRGADDLARALVERPSSSGGAVWPWIVAGGVGAALAAGAIVLLVTGQEGDDTGASVRCCELP